MIECFVEDGVGVLTLNRPDKRNALSPQLLRELIGHCTALAADTSVRAVVLTGGAGCFSAGADLLAFLPELQGPDALAAADLGRLAAQALAELEVPTVALVDGPCVGGGVVLCSACDLVLASASARFRVPEVALGVPLAWGGTTRLVQRIGPVATGDLVMTCRWVDAEEAQRLGLASRVVADGELGATGLALARELASRPRRALAWTKQQIRAAVAGQPVDEADAEALVAALSDPETLQAAQVYLMEELGRDVP